ncbi:MAG: hypothetical protein WD696_09385 [Bryobacteraceae bacterium]
MAEDRGEMPDEPPPFLGTWPRVYAAVLLYLAALIAVFYVFTKTFQ